MIFLSNVPFYAFFKLKIKCFLEEEKQCEEGRSPQPKEFAGLTCVFETQHHCMCSHPNACVHLWIIRFYLDALGLQKEVCRYTRTLNQSPGHT